MEPWQEADRYYLKKEDAWIKKCKRIKCRYCQNSRTNNVRDGVLRMLLYLKGLFCVFAGLFISLAYLLAVILHDD